MLLLDHYPSLPGCCRLCKGTAVPAVDTLREVMYEGRVYLCADCVRELGSLIGMLDADAADALHKEHDALLARVHEAEADRQEALDAVEAMRTAGFGTDEPPDPDGGTDDDDYVCRECDRTFGSPRSLGQHARTHHVKESQ